MNKGLKDRDVLRLLARRKKVEVGYPSDAMTTRREAYVKQAAAAAALIQAMDNDLKVRGKGDSSGAGGAGMGSSSAAMWLEAALVIVIVVEAGFAAYLHRKKIADFIDTARSTNKVEHVVNPPEEFPSWRVVVPVTGEESNAASPVVTPPSAVPLTITGSAAETASPARPPSTHDVTEKVSAEDAVEVQSTPLPKSDSGLHLGQTPKPERTRPSNNDKPSNDDKQPNENKPPSNGGGNK